jgi:hypothetical protein
MHKMFRRTTPLRSIMAAALLLSAPLLSALPLAAQSARQTIITLSDRAIKERGSNLTAAAQVIPLDVNLAKLHSATGPELRLASVPLAPGLAVDLDLREYSLIEPDAILTATGDDGVTPLPGISARLFKGHVAGDEGARAYLAIGDHVILGTVVVGGKSYEIANDWSARQAGASIAAVAYPLADVHISSGHCGVDESNLEALGYTPEKRAETEKMMAMAKPVAVTSAPTEIKYSVKGAFDADYEYYQIFGSKEAATEYMYEVIGRTSAIYENDFGCQIRVGYLNIYTTGNDPYNIAPPSAMQNALTEEVNHWNSAKQDIPRAFTNVFSGKPWEGTIGIAYLSTLCESAKLGYSAGFSYGFCAITKSNPEQDIVVTAHENGHIFGSLHTHSCSWNPEIDRCAAAEEGSCFTAAQIKDTIGTIMSYCSQHELKFHPKCIDVILQKLQKYPCVELARRLVVKPPRIYFAAVERQTDTTIADYFSNPSEEPITVKGITLEGALAGQFEVITPKDSFTIKPGETKPLTIRYLATSKDFASVKLTVIHNAYNAPNVTVLEAYPLDRQPQLGLVSGAEGIDFKVHKVGEKVDTAFPNFYRNRGLADLHVDKVELVGPDRFDFKLVEGTGPFDIVASGANVGLKLRFEPTTPGIKSAWLRAASNSPNKVDSIHISGNVKVGPLLRLKTNNLTIDFHDRPEKIPVDTTLDGFFYNAGSDSMLVTAKFIGKDTNSFPVDFALLDMPPGATEPLTLHFYDSIPGAKESFMVINHVDYQTLAIYRRDTLRLIGTIVAPSSVPGEAEAAAGLAIAPNPASGSTIVTVAPLAGEAGRSYSLVINDLLGREVYRHADRFASGETRLPLETTGWAAGRYYLTLKCGDEVRTRTLTIER